MKNTRIFLILTLLGLSLPGQAQKAPAAKALVKRTYYDYAGRQLHEEYQYVSTPTNRFSKQGYYKEYNEDGTLWRKHQYRNNKAEGRQLEYYTTDGETWLEYDMMVHNGLLNGPYIKYAGPGDKLLAGRYLNGEKTGSWTEYGSDGSQRATYYLNNEPYTGRLEERYANGSLRQSVQYYKGMRAGYFQTWYPSGTPKEVALYRSDKLYGPVKRYLADGTPDAATQQLLAEETAATLAQRADSAQQAAATPSASHKSPYQQALEARQTATRNREKTTQLLADARAALDDVLYLEERAKEKSGAASTFPPSVSAYSQLYDKLTLAYQTAMQTADGPDEGLAIAQRLCSAMQAARTVFRGQNPELKLKLGTETQPDRILALMGL